MGHTACIVCRQNKVNVLQVRCCKNAVVNKSARNPANAIHLEEEYARWNTVRSVVPWRPEA